MPSGRLKSAKVHEDTNQNNIIGDLTGGTFAIDSGDRSWLTADIEFNGVKGAISEMPAYTGTSDTLTVPAVNLRPDQFIPFPPPLPGDVDGDRFVGGADLTQIMSNWSMLGSTREQGDLTYDAFVGGGDYTEVLSNWGTGTPPEVIAAVPELATLGLLLAGVVLLRRRKSGLRLEENPR